MAPKAADCKNVHNPNLQCKNDFLPYFDGFFLSLLKVYDHKIIFSWPLCIFGSKITKKNVSLIFYPKIPNPPPLRPLCINSRRRGRLSPGMSLTSSYQCSCQRASCSRGWEGILDQWAEKAGGVSTVVLPRTSRMLTSMKSSGFPICLSCVSVQADVKVARENQTPDASASISRF